VLTKAREGEKTVMLRRALLPSGCLVALLAAVIIGQEREQLKSPVFHVSKDQAEEMQRGPAPVLENSAAPTRQEAVVPAQVAPSVDAPAGNSLPTAVGPEPAREEPIAEVARSVQPMAATPAPPTVPEVSEARKTLDLAIEDARANLLHINQNIRDYTCLFIKQENVRGEILPSEYMELKVRNRQVQNGKLVVPFSVYCKFRRPSEVKNREVLYVEGRYKSPKILVKEGAGARRLLPAVPLSVNSPLVMSTNRYPMTEIGLANLTQRLIDRSVADPDVDDCEVTYQSGAKMDGRPCKFLQVKRPVPKVGPAAEQGMNVYLAQVLIDEELRVPIRYAAYMWPTTPGSRPEVVEMYTYKDLELNVGLTDADFDHRNSAYNF
jgi:hypothetical protein